MISGSKLYFFTSIRVYDLQNMFFSNKSYTLPVESKLNYVTVDLSPNGCTLIAINEEGEAHMISLVSQTIVHRYRFKGKCRAIKFSPDGKYFAVCKDNNGKSSLVYIVLEFATAASFMLQFLYSRLQGLFLGSTMLLLWNGCSTELMTKLLA